ncbi:MAG: CoA ester lyase [Comamonadaceae bacterium]|nr:MAG: CoA ester lyase [Comamonadaceae bacterium]
MTRSRLQVEVWRSLLFVPANEQRFMAKAHQRGAGAIILDLEDAIAPGEKEAARACVHAAVETLRQTGVANVLVRINPGSDDDIAAAVSARVDAIVVPKPDRVDDLQRVSAVLDRAEREAGLDLGHVRLLVLVETPAAIVNAASLAAHERVEALILGSEDLALALGVEPTPDSMTHAASAIVFAARASGKVPLGVPGSLATITDAEAFAALVVRARAIGMAGTVCIHPNQVVAVRRAYASTPEDIERAKGILAAFDEAERAGRGAVMFDGKMLDLPIIERARRTLAHNDAGGSAPGERP